MNPIDTTLVELRARHEHKYTKYKMRLTLMMVIRNKQHVSNI